MKATSAATGNDYTRERLLAFAQFVWRRFLDDKCFEAAGALSYVSVFALVPLSTVALGIIAAFPLFKQWSALLTDFIFANFLPAAGSVVQTYITGFAENAEKLTTIGVFALLIAALLLMSSVESQFNRIWRVPPRRSRLARLVVYWAVLTVGPLLLAASLGATNYLFTLPTRSDVLGFVTWLAGSLPVIVTWITLTLGYLVIPNAVYRPRHAAIGAVVATVLFQAVKYAFAVFLGNANFEQVYGALATIPIFLVWLYLTWSVILLGASLAASLSAFRFQPRALRIPPGLEFAVLLRVLRHLAQAAARGAPLDRTRVLLREPGLTDEQLDRFLDLLRDLQVIQQNETCGWLLLRDPAAVPISELFEAGGFRLPNDSELRRLHARATEDDAPLLAWLTEARAAIQSAVATPIARMIGRPVAAVTPPAGANP